MIDMQSKRDLQIVGQRIKDIREKLGLTMAEFAKQIDPSGNAKSGTVSNWEHGRNAPNIQRLKRVAELGNVPIEYVQGKTNDSEGWETIQARSGYTKQQIKSEIEVIEDENNKDDLRSLQRLAVISLDSKNNTDLDAVNYAIDTLSRLLNDEEQRFYFDQKKLATLKRLKDVNEPLITKEDRLSGTLLNENMSNGVFLELEHALTLAKESMLTIKGKLE